ncbi:hypothetical protein D9619_005355 [Psilocybe cf. subviscida]|uniref:gamma-glutamylcyclotransferase n=1 Tax=Psilocybe cf. subviscida TaxID=2480587 RepID=A0A8H5FC96_9AGAR|nr:hypothetical protein D9619_005355 [Psilocybe cf. subviscida]
MSNKRIYFGYGSNLWLDQMKRRCPRSKYIGVGVLQDWKWIINVRGYANIIPSIGDIVYGLMYELTEQDEHDLDTYEGSAYSKLNLDVKQNASDPLSTPGGVISALVYVDVVRKSESPDPKTEYIYRMNKGIEDALAQGVPKEYIEKYLRAFIPAPDN